MGFIWNIYEKSFTPYFASLAPKNQVHRHVMVSGKNKLSPFWQSKRVGGIMRFIRRYILQNTKLYHLGILMCKFFEVFTQNYANLLHNFV